MEEQRTHEKVNGNAEKSSNDKSKDVRELPNRKKSLTRHLDHLADLTNGVHYTPVPEPLRSAWFDKKISDTKARFILTMIGKSADFQLKSSYLRKRFSSANIKEFTRELVEDGVLRLAKVKVGAGKPSNVHHVNPMSMWDLREVRPGWKRAPRAKSAIVNGSNLNGLDLNGLDLNGLKSPLQTQTDPTQSSLTESDSTHPRGAHEGKGECEEGSSGVLGDYEKIAQFDSSGSPINSWYTKLAFDVFDDIFFDAEARRNRGKDSLGFNFEEANQAVADVVIEVGVNLTKEFARYLKAYKASTGLPRIKPSDLPKLLKQFKVSNSAEIEAIFQ